MAEDKPRPDPTLGILAVAAAVMMEGMYGDGRFSVWDAPSGVLLCAIVFAYWNLVVFEIFPNVAISIMVAAGAVMMTGWVVESLLGSAPSETARTLVLTCYWILLAIPVYWVRHHRLFGGSNG